MKIIRKIIRITAFILIVALFSCAITLFVITDPNVPIKEFGEFDMAPLNKLTEKYDLYDSDGEFICSATKSGNLKIEFEEISDNTKNAFISIEDARFYEHGAIDIKRIGGAIVKDVATMSAKEGASTITQQLVKNTYLSPEKTISRKVREIRIARAIEQRLSKDEILGLYLNSLYFGNNIYGIETASQRFFGKSASKLELDESATLAAIINNPKKFDPFKNKDNTESRKRLVLKRMFELGHISQKEYDSACEETVFTNRIANENLFFNYAVAAAEQGTVRTAYDRDIQKTVTGAVNGLVDSSEYTVAAVVFDVKTEEIVAAASNTYMNLAGVKRQPGSTIKPLLCYAPALDSGIITPVTPLLDEPTNFGGYMPNNYLGQYYGWTTASECLSKSLNIPAVKLLNMNGVDKSKTTASKLGITFSANDNGLALALGGMEYGVDICALGRAYCKIADGGKKAIKPESAYFINRMLTDCARNGTAKKLSDIPNIAAKTGTVGTSNGNTDAYCIAYNRRYVTAVWAGALNGTLPEEITGGGLPTEICAEIMKRPELKSGAFDRPKTIVSIDIDSSELYKNHKVLAAKSTTLPKDRFSAEFSIFNMPDKKTDEDLFFGDYEDFRIVDGFID